MQNSDDAAGQPPALTMSAGWFDGVRRRPSPNYDARPDDEISLIVVHCISLPAGHYANRHVCNLFQNCLDLEAHPDFHDLCGVLVSSHLLIRRDGEVLQFVPLHRRAWHAGQSAFAGRSACNDFSVGIELEGTDDSPFEPAQYTQLARLCRSIMTHWSVPLEHIVGHSDIAPGRKTDPGSGFDWDLFRTELAQC